MRTDRNGPSSSGRPGSGTSGSLSADEQHRMAGAQSASRASLKYLAPSMMGVAEWGVFPPAGQARSQKRNVAQAGGGDVPGCAAFPFPMAGL